MTTTAYKAQLHYSWVMLTMATLVVFGALGLARFAYSPILPQMQGALDMTNAQAGALATGNFVGYLLLAVIGGALASKFGPRLVIALSMSLIGLTMILTGLADRFWLALLWRALTGLGSGGSNVPVMGLLAAWFASRRRGLATGVAVAGSSVALILTGYIVPPILDAYGDNGWRAAWIILGAIVLGLALLSWVFLRNHPSERNLAPLGGAEEAPPGQRASSLDWGKVYYSRAVWHLAGIYAAFGFSYIIYITFFSKFLIAEAGLTDQSAGQLWSLVGWFSLFCGVIWGAVSDRWGRKIALIMVFGGHIIAYLLFALVGEMTAFFVSSIVFGLTAWSIPAIMAAACADQVGSRLAPAAVGFVTLFFGIGQAAGPYVAGLLADTLSSFVPALLLAAGVTLLGVLGSLFLRPTARPPVVAG